MGYRLRPYLLIAMAALIACLPVSSMLFTLKNDVLAIEYPVQYFISEALRQGENPVWFNSWCMGFPLQSVLTWSVFSTPRTLLGTLLPSDIVVLQLEFLFYVMAAGWIMFALLKNHFSTERNLALLLACCYMLSGFTVGSSQWLLYLTGLSFIPLVIYAALSLSKRPSWSNAFFLALAWYLLFTNVHIYLSVFTAYFLVFFFAGKLLFYWTNPETSPVAKWQLTRFVLAALLLTLAVSAAPVWYTLELLSWLERGNPLESGQTFFQSNYLHPEELKSLLLPLGTVKSTHPNTEGSIQTLYMGLLPLLLLVPSLQKNIKEHNRIAGWILLLSLFFLMLSFGHLTPFRNALNFLPGMSYFRHPGVLRAFFVMGFIIYLGVSFRQTSLASLLKPGSANRKLIIGLLIFLGAVLLLVIGIRSGSLGNVWKGSFYESTRQAQSGELEALNAILQLLAVAALLFTALRKTLLFPVVLLLEMVLNFLCCTPFYMVSSHSAAEVNQLFSYTRGFPVQQVSPYRLPAEIPGNGITVWRNSNTFQKKVSTEMSLPGPLVLERVGHFLSSPGKDELRDQPLVFIRGQRSISDSITLLRQGPGKVVAAVQLSAARELVLQQGYFPGWKVYYNGKEIPMVKNDLPFLSARVPAGKGELVFRFRKDGVLYSAFFLHFLVLASLFMAIRRRYRLISSSPSSPY